MGPAGTAASLETLPLSGMQSWGWFIKVARTLAGTSWLLILLSTAEMSLVVGVHLPTQASFPVVVVVVMGGCLKAPACGPAYFLNHLARPISWVKRSGNRAFIWKLQAKINHFPFRKKELKLFKGLPRGKEGGHAINSCLT